MAEPYAVVLVSNGPGELTTWVRPLALCLHRRRPLAPRQPDAPGQLRLVLVPCPNGTGQEHRAAGAWQLFTQITPARRFWWLLLNLGTAIVASAVIGLFDATIEQMVALAVLMPIVASMGGNAGTQTMTVAVRAIATRDLTAANTVRVVLRETAVGLINGIVFAVLMGTIAIIWFDLTLLGAVIAAAMIINMLAAALAGIFIPLMLDRQGYDPAVSSTVFVTTVTDVVGFFAFLGLASLVLL
jgi:Mg/Co/Ni transporter MgtE